MAFGFRAYCLGFGGFRVTVSGWPKPIFGVNPNP